jgi:putative ATP-binding cassette transporter
MNHNRRRAVLQSLHVARFLLGHEGRKRLLFWLIAVIGFLIAVNGLNVLNSYVGRDFISAVSHRDGHAYWKYAYEYCGVFAASSVGGALLRFSEDRFRVVWREIGTTRLIERYLENHMFLRLIRVEEIDNPDQRMTDDVRTFTGMAEGVVALSANAAVTSFAFLGVLWSITPWLVVTAFVYAGIGSAFAIALGRPLIRLNDRQLTKEASLRYQLMRIRETAETLAVAGAERSVGRHLHAFLIETLENFKAIVRVTRNLVAFTNFYGYMLQLVPVLVVAPLYLHRQVEFGVVTQAVMAFSQVMGALSLIVTQYETMSPFFAVSDRVDSLIRATEKPKPSELGVKLVEADHVAFVDVTLHPPDDPHPLVRALTLSLNRRQTLLVSGTSLPSMKALLLALAGVGDAGEGHILRPPNAVTAFLPRHAFVPSGTLREVLTLGGRSSTSSDADLLEALRTVGLEKLAEDQAGLDVYGAWQRTLSPGDQQRLAIARLLVLRPKLAILDHVPEALRHAEVEMLFAKLAAVGITFVTFGEPGLQRYHDVMLELRDHGTWHVRP